MKLSLTLVALAVALVYGIIVTVAPDFPISEEVLLAFIVYVLAKLGVEIAAPALRAALVRIGFKGFKE